MRGGLLQLWALRLVMTTQPAMQRTGFDDRRLTVQQLWALVSKHKRDLGCGPCHRVVSMATELCSHERKLLVDELQLEDVQP